MADIRINSLPSTATSFNTDDYIPLDGASGGTRKMLAATLPLTDVKFGGTSGPSAKSSIAARAARQEIVGDGTATTGSVSVPAFGTSAFSVFAFVQPTSLPGSESAIFTGSTNSFALKVKSTGKLEAAKTGVANHTQSTGSVVAGKQTLIGFVRDGDTGTYYIDGVAAGTASGLVSVDYSAALTSLGASSAWSGSIYPAIYNRALTAAEVVSLYEAGVPAGTDFVQISDKTAISEVNVSGSTIGATSFSWTGTTPTGFFGWNLGPPNSLNAVLIKGKRYRVAFTVASISGFAGNGLMLNSRAAGTNFYTASNQYPITAAGTYSYEFTTSASETNFGISLSQAVGSAVAGSVSVTGVSVTPVGLLLAPDAAQAGGGLTWYDTSGNAANITLPATGVTWNVPTSGNVTSGGNVVLAPATGYKTYTSKTIQSQVGTGSTSIANVEANSALITQAAGGTLGLFFGHDTTANRPLIQSVTGGTAFSFLLNPYGGNVLLGTTTDGGNGKLQLASHTTSAGGIGFGPDTSMFRGQHGNIQVSASGAGQWTTLQLNAYDTNSSAASCYNPPGTLSGSNPLWFVGQKAGSLGTLQMWAYNGSVHLTTAQTLDTSGNATFAGTLTAGNIFSKRSDNTGVIRLIATSGVSAGSDIESYAPSTSAWARLNFRSTVAAFYTGASANTLALTVDDSQRTILAGALRLNNAYVAGAPTATGYVTIQDSAGNTYKVLVGT